MRIIYIGTVDFSFHCLDQVLKNKGEVVGVVTTQNSHNNSDFRDLTPLADRYNIPVHYCRSVNDPETIQWIKDNKPDIIFCWGWSQLIKTEILSLPPMGVVGVHPALLPQNRGRHPLIWALALGLKESGLTFFFIDEGADSGPILSQKKFTIEDNDSAATLYEKIKLLASDQIAEFLPKLKSRTHCPVKQDSSHANYWRKRNAQDGLIDWRMSTRAVLNLVRALTCPYPGAQCRYKNQLITVWKAQEYLESVPDNAEPGKILYIKNGKPVIKTYNGAVSINEWEPHIEFNSGDYMS